MTAGAGVRSPTSTERRFVGEPGEILLGKYRVESELGRGGMGRVLAVRHLELGETVAIKLVLPGYAESPDVVRRFMREARACAQIRSEHVCKVSDVGRLPTGEPYMIMEMLHGQDLSFLLADSKPLPIVDVVEYMLQALEAIAEAHAAGIVHRDLKPANLFLTQRRNGTPCIKVLDFGISKLGTELATAGAALTQTCGILGSPLYMSPEQLESAKDVDPRADVWALGVILYQLLTGRLPFEADSLPQLVLKVISSAPVSMQQLRPEIPAELESVVLRCLAKLRSARFAHVGELAVALLPFGRPSAALSVRAIESFSPALRVAGGNLSGLLQPMSQPGVVGAALRREAPTHGIADRSEAREVPIGLETQLGQSISHTKGWVVLGGLLGLLAVVGGGYVLSTRNSSAKSASSTPTNEFSSKPIAVPETVVVAGSNTSVPSPSATSVLPITPAVSLVGVPSVATIAMPSLRVKPAPSSPSSAKPTAAVSAVAKKPDPLILSIE